MADSPGSGHWAAELFRGLPESALLQGLRVVAVCTERARAPDGYVDIWRAPQSELQETEAGEPDEDSGLLICSDVCDDGEFESVRLLMREICCRPEPPQLLLLLPRAVQALDDVAMRRCYKERLELLLEEGFDEVILCQPSGFNLCLQVHAKVSATRQRLEDGLRAYHKRKLLVHEQAKAKHIVDFTMWHWLPAKVTRMIPRMRRDLHPEPLADVVAGFSLVKRLGGGFYGQVYAAVATPAAEAAATRGTAPVPTEAIKVVDKTGLVGMREIKMLHHMITVHNLLSSPRLQHANIAVLRDVYHSPSHLFFHMEYAGPESLYSRLAASVSVAGDEANGEVQPQASCARKYRPITTPALRALIAQTTSAVAHLHLNAGACHRDLKLENFVVAAGTGGPQDIPHVKLVDFDFARVVQELPETHQRHRCHGKCGTVPYVAPEVACERSYDGMAADVWSLGVLFLEVLCGVRVMEGTFDIQHQSHFSGGQGVLRVASRIRRAFERPGYAAELAEAKVREEARPLLEISAAQGGITQLLKTMLCVVPEQRAGMAQVQPVVDAFMAAAGPFQEEGAKAAPMQALMSVPVQP